MILHPGAYGHGHLLTSHALVLCICNPSGSWAPGAQGCSASAPSSLHLTLHAWASGSLAPGSLRLAITTPSFWSPHLNTICIPYCARRSVPCAANEYLNPRIAVSYNLGVTAIPACVRHVTPSMTGLVNSRRTCVITHRNHSKLISHQHTGGHILG